MNRRILGQPKILVVDDEPDLLELLELTLSRMGLDTTRAESVAEAIKLLDREPFDLCLSDMRRAGRGDHGLRLGGERRGGAEGRRVRLSG